MNREPDPSLGRVLEGGADILAIADASVLVVVDEIVDLSPWTHPVWPLCRALAALGFGGIEICGGKDSVDELSDLMRRAAFTQVSELESLEGLADGSAPCDLVFYLGNDAGIRERCASVARTMRTPVRAISWGTSWVAMESRAPGEEGAQSCGVPTRETSREPLPAVARMAAGLALQEALIVAGRLEVASPPAPLVFFDAASETRSADRTTSGWYSVDIGPAVVEVVGAGGIGTHLLESLAPLLTAGSELRIFDFDSVGPENLAVQSVFGPENVGRPKAEVMAEKLGWSCDPALAIEAFVMRYEDRPEDLSTPSLRVLCPDTFSARAHANDCSLVDGAPLAEAGSSPLVAQQRTYAPGITACLEHRIPDLQRRVIEERDRAACGYGHAITLPGVNMIAGGLLALEALRAMDPFELGPPSDGTIVYDARFPQRFGVIEPRPPCCH
jgi:molybdopterin/thiamine biosynthesis adenylyltransferase